LKREYKRGVKKMMIRFVVAVVVILLIVVVYSALSVSKIKDEECSKLEKDLESTVCEIEK